MIGLVVALALASAAGQAPTGTIHGTVTDASGALVAGARVTIVNQATSQIREMAVSDQGVYNVPALPPGTYRVTGEASGFKRSERLADVEAGTTTWVDLVLEVGDVSETVNVRAATPVLRYDHHQIAGVVRREQIESLPLNGRNFLELVSLEPGVTNPVHATNNRTFVAALGSGLQTAPRVGFTRVTVDGANINTLHTIGAILQVSQDVVQEFQMATANFDLSAGATTSGSINIVTRSGGNTARGSVFSFYRDHHLSAYPGLSRDPEDPDPFFRRHQFGATAGGPIRRDRAFFLASAERHSQRSVISIQPNDSDFAPLGGIFPSPYDGTLFTARVDGRVRANHTAFARYTHDGNSAFTHGNPTARVLPSGWMRATNDVNQNVVALTSVLSPTVVNDLRFSYFALDNPERPANSESCPGCFGVGAPRIRIPSINLALGRLRSLDVSGHRFQLTDDMTRQSGRHTLRFGFEWERTVSTSSQIDRDPAEMTLWSPSDVRQRNSSVPLPSSFATIDDVLRLPLRSFETAVGPGIVPQRDFLPHRVTDLYRIYANDTWHAHPRLTVNAGVSWFFEPNALNHDLDKPALLAPILGADDLEAPPVRYSNVTPAIGVAWTATRDDRTVVRGGVGRYVDPLASTNITNLSMERAALLPVGTTRLIIPGSDETCGGTVLDFPQPTTFTAADLLACLPDIRARYERALNPGNRDFGVRNIDLTKSGRNLSDPFTRAPSAMHVTVGIQRELSPGFVVSADFVAKRFFNTFINGIDYNRWNSASGPVIPRCVGAQLEDVSAACSRGAIYFDTTGGRARYRGLLVRADKRFSTTAQVMASYALGSYVGSNGTGTATAENTGGRVFGFNNDDWFENVGPMPTDERHVLNVSAFFALPWRFQMGFSVSAYSRPPFTAYVSGFDFNGDGTSNDLLPWTRVNQFGRSLTKDDLARLVARYNQEIAGRPLCCGQNAPRPLVLPDDYSFDDTFFTQDLRLSRTFAIGTRGARGARVSLSAELFNLLNTANLTGFSGNLGDRTVFGQPSGRVSQVFGSGGPRAVQLAARLGF